MDNSYKDIWNERHREKVSSRDNIKIDDWLEKYSDIIEECDTSIIDLGCGSGNDTLYLVNHGKKVVSLDYSEVSIQKIKENIPEATAILHDITKGLPFENNCTQLVIADLSLHYFSRATTENIINEIKRILKKNGYLLLRVNSVNDINYGADKGEKIEEHFYLVEDNDKKKMTKRFFDETDIREFFKEWEIERISEEKMGRYGTEKILWESCIKNIK